MRLTWHPDAEKELIEDAKFYEQRAAGLGADFLDSVDTAVEQIVQDPQRFPIIEENIQRCRVKRFPYCVYFRCLPGLHSCRETSQSSFRLLETAQVNLLGRGPGGSNAGSRDVNVSKKGASAFALTPFEIAFHGSCDR
jgi:hypothetical protein